MLTTLQFRVEFHANSTANSTENSTKEERKEKMSDKPIPQLTDLGERLAQDKDRKHLESLLERLPDPTNSTTEPARSLPNEQGADSRREAVKSARHILQTVWSMQHMEKLTKQP